MGKIRTWNRNYLIFINRYISCCSCKMSALYFGHMASCGSSHKDTTNRVGVDGWVHKSLDLTQNTSAHFWFLIKNIHCFQSWVFLTVTKELFSTKKPFPELLWLVNSSQHLFSVTILHSWVTKATIWPID